MPRPPARRGRVAGQKAGARPVQPTPTTKRRVEDADGFRAAHRPLSVSKPSSGSGLEDAKRRIHETPRTTRLPGARGGQPLASALRRADDASSKIQKIGTPGFDSSMLSNFRPRPRQPSILHLMDDDEDEDGSSDLDSEAFLGSFHPEDESTPLNLGRRKTLPPAEALPPSPSPRKQNAVHQSTPSVKKRRLFAVEVPVLDSDGYSTLHSDQITAGDAAVDNEEQQQQQPDDDAADHSSDDDSIPLPEPLDQQLSPEILSQTMAPPISSSPIFSPPQASTQPSKPTPSQTRRLSSHQLRISTATLRENLLPLRRRRRQLRPRSGMEQFDVPTDSDDEEENAGRAADEDELSYLPNKDGRRRTKKNPLKSNRQGVNKKIERPSRTSRGGKDKGSTAETTWRTWQSRPAKAQLTYSRRRSPDKENDDAMEASDVPQDDAPEDASHVICSKELLKAKKFFAEVDQWQMDFEDVSGEQSSPYR
ncbi:hypothetical protein VTO42DRAFT_5128 [Malbranchea cinnamomea]